MGQVPKPLDPSASALAYFGAELRLLRQRAGLSVAGLGRRVFRHASLISCVERGERFPQQQLADACDRELDTGGALSRLWMLVAAERDRQQPSLPSWINEEVGTTDRRHFLAAAAAAPLLATLTPERGGVTAAHARHARALPPALYQLDDSHGGLALRDLAVEGMRRVDHLLESTTYNTAAGTELQIAYGELAEMAGWLSFDAGHYGPARSYLDEALRAAQLADDLNLEILVLASMNTLARYQHRPREAIQLIQLAQRRANGWAPPRLRTLLLAREAVCWAQLHDTGASRRTMHRADNTFDPAHHPDDPAWIGFFDQAELAARHATAHAYLGDHHNAATSMSSAVQQLAPEYRRNRAYYSIRHGLLLHKTGDITSAVSAVEPALPFYDNVRSGRAHTRLQQVLTTVRNDPAARDLIEQADQMNLLPT